MTKYLIKIPKDSKTFGRRQKFHQKGVGVLKLCPEVITMEIRIHRIYSRGTPRNSNKAEARGHNHFKHLFGLIKELLEKEGYELLNIGQAKTLKASSWQPSRYKRKQRRKQQ